MKHLAISLALACTGALAASPALAADPNLARNLVANCANCHGTEGKAVQGTAMVPIAGTPKELLVSKFKGYRSGALPATVMHQIAKGYTDEQIELIADYLAARK